MNPTLPKQISLSFLFLFIPCVIFSPAVAQDSIYTTAVAWSDDGVWIAATTIQYEGEQNSLTVFDTSAGQEIYTIETAPAASLAWSPDGRYIAVGGFNTVIEIIDFERREIVTTLLGHRATVNWLDWSNDGTRLVSAGTTDRLVILWDMTSYQMLRTMTTSDPWVAVFSPDGQTISVGGGAGIELVPANLDVPIYAERQAYRYETSYAAALAWSPDGISLAIGNITLPDHPALRQIFDTVSKLPINIDTDQASIYGVDWSADGSLIATSSNDGSVRIWDASDLSTPIEGYQGVTVHSNKLTFSPFGGRLAYGLSVSAEQAARGASLADSGVAIVVPAPSLERLNVIAQGCISPAGLRDVALVTEVARLPEYIAQVEALSDEQISTGCRADVLAVARAVQSLP